jgi:HAD superfamily hydrolase (TIGR01549 family)
VSDAPSTTPADPSAPPNPSRTVGDEDELSIDQVDEGIDAIEDAGDFEDVAVDTQEVPDPDGVAPSVVVFDIGEVLIDESRVWAIWSGLLGVSPLTFAAVLGAAITQGGDHLDVFPHIAPNIDWEDFLDEHERRYGGFHEEDLYTDAVPCLTELRELGFRVIIAGNQPAIRSEQLRALELPQELIITSAELGAGKPDQAFFTGLLRAGELSDPSDVLYVGDRVDNDVLPAAAMGMRTCWLRRGPWGHLQELPDDVEPDLVLDGLGELPLLLSEWRG